MYVEEYISTTVHYYQWRSYTRAHTGPGPGEFLSALVNHARSTYVPEPQQRCCINYRIM